MYGLEDEKENEVEREFLFSDSGSYVELRAYPVLKLMKLNVPQVLEGYVNGCWVCILAFHANRCPNFTCIPCKLSVSRYPFRFSLTNAVLNSLSLSLLFCFVWTLEVSLSQLRLCLIVLP